MFALDRDIALLDPAVFRGVEWAGLTITRGDGLVSGTTLSAIGSLEVPFTQTNISEGHVVTIAGLLMEVVSVVSGDSLEVSVPRAAPGDPAQTPRQLVTTPFTVLSFRPQLEWVHRQVLAMLGLRPPSNPPGAPTSDPRLGEESVTNPADFTRLEALGALHLIWSAAGALEDASHAANQRAAMYRRRFAEERQRAVALIDTDGDGEPDAIRRLNVLQLSRA